MKKYLIILEKTKTGYSVYVPDLHGCIATGETREIAQDNIYEAIKFHLEGLQEENLLKQQKIQIRACNLL
ncbi:MAG: type II toxin-antitoxin system HicB family antitoxin [Bacteroidales bacterium]|nr:type II toxin-antitoxin system HicB family antitoxin [Bacteroidales bacterium]